MSTVYPNKAAFGVLIGTAAILALCTPAKATLIGQTIQVTSETGFPPLTVMDSVVVGLGAELDGNIGGSQHTDQFFLFPGDTIDIGESSITFTFAPVAGFEFAFISTFEDLIWADVAGEVTGVEILDPNGVVNLGAQANVLTPSSIQFQGTVDLDGGATFTLDLDVTHEVPPPAAAISEPTTLPLFAAGLMAFAFLARRRGAR